ncbi:MULTISPECIES: nucleotide exchange factor GrpE [Legionella]|uniref:Protein GrpE n=1 Tax=Legionella maceachernii TaxID=466 RepID=A0A0W0VWR0_9GAMM|nr:nucleotide exchange factor GrpE [Legionella maceachernii]KTD24472.1 Heat-shock protein GrpE(HSP-70 cofactor) [Legionella maceachernii]SJZ59859.1 molecular chaperone GrpE [Legionella maceachernii]SUP00803.1 HSP-70 cofactor [Legionella maceachernii]
MNKDKSKDWRKIKKESELDEMESSEEEREDDEEGGASGGEAALEHPSYAVLEEKLTLAEQQAHENWEKAVRAMAELENVRRRAERDVANAHRYGLEKLIHGFLPVIDSLEQALQLAEKHADESMREGLSLTIKLFMDALKKLEVEQIDPLGAVFNPQEHEAMSMQEAKDAEPNTVLAVFQKGYKLNDRVIRPARVIVAKPKPINEKA